MISLVLSESLPEADAPVETTAILCSLFFTVSRANVSLAAAAFLVFLAGAELEDVSAVAVSDADEAALLLTGPELEAAAEVSCVAGADDESSELPVEEHPVAASSTANPAAVTPSVRRARLSIRRSMLLSCFLPGAWAGDPVPLMAPVVIARWLLPRP